MKSILPSEEQLKVIYFPSDQHRCMLACAGSGKTETLVRTILRMIIEEGCNPEDFFIVSYTKNSARDICERLNKKLIAAIIDGQITDEDRISCLLDADGNVNFERCGTFHALSMRILNKLSDLESKVVESKDSKAESSLPKETATSTDKEDREEVGFTKASIASPSQADSTTGSIDSKEDSKGAATPLMIIPPSHVDESQYHFADFLRSPSKQATELRAKIKYVFVDEFQDVNQIQFDIVKELSKTCKSVTVIGDDSQNLYTFRGSSVKFIRELGQHLPGLKTLYLSINYRSTPPIVALANAHLSVMRRGAVAPLKPPTASSSEAVVATGDDVSSFSPPSVSGLPEFDYSGCTSKDGEAAGGKGAANCPVPWPKPILYNTACGFEAIREVCKEIKRKIDGLWMPGTIGLGEYMLNRKLCSGIPPHSPVKPSDICILARNNWMLDATHTVLKEMGIKVLFYSGEDGFARNVPESMRKNCVALSTIHASKGLEWEHLYIEGLHRRHFPSTRSERSQEDRLMYVALTRGRKHITLCNSSLEPSPFITQLPNGASYFHVVGNIRWGGGVPPPIPPASIKMVSLVGASIATGISSSSLAATGISSASAVRLVGDAGGSMPPLPEILGVVDCIRRLDGNHYITLKRDILPRDLTSLLAPTPWEKLVDILGSTHSLDAATVMAAALPKPPAATIVAGESTFNPASAIAIASASASFAYAKFITEAMIEREFGQFLDLLSRRMVAQYLHRRSTITTTSSESKASKTSVVRTESKLSCAGGSRDSSSGGFPAFKVWDAERCLEGGDKFKTVPSVFVAKLKRAYDVYKDPTQDCIDIVDKIYQVSLASSIVKGRQAILYSDVKKMNLLHYIGLYQRLEKRIATLIGNKYARTNVTITEACANGSATHITPKFFYIGGTVNGLGPDGERRESMIPPEEEVFAVDSTGDAPKFLPPLKGSIDLLIDDRIFIDFKNTHYHSDHCHLDHFIQVLSYSAIKDRPAAASGSIIVGVFNIVADTLFLKDVTDWTQGKRLCKFLKETTMSVLDNGTNT
jgi:hypothetical protein